MKRITSAKKSMVITDTNPRLAWMMSLVVKGFMVCMG